MTPGSPLYKKARHTLAMNPCHDEDSSEYDDLLFHTGTAEFRIVDMFSFPRIIEEARATRRKALVEMAASIRKQMAPEGTRQYAHATNVKDEAAAIATKKALEAFQQARKEEREHRARRLEQAKKEKAAGGAR